MEIEVSDYHIYLRHNVIPFLETSGEVHNCVYTVYVRSHLLQ